MQCRKGAPRREANARIVTQWMRSHSGDRRSTPWWDEPWRRAGGRTACSSGAVSKACLQQKQHVNALSFAESVIHPVRPEGRGSSQSGGEMGCGQPQVQTDTGV